MLLFVAILALLISGLSYENESNSSGVIISMGPIKAHFAGAYSIIKSLRYEFDSKLPIEIWFFSYLLPNS